MHEIYCISGLGADHCIFEKLKIENANLHFIKWSKPQKGDDLRQYALRLAAQIKHPQIILMGVSFGGMLATEIAWHFQQNPSAAIIHQTILVSSCKHPSEFPVPMKLIGKLNLHKLAPYHLIFRNNRLNRFVFDLRSTEEELYLKRKMLKDNEFGFLKHAIHMIMKWKRKAGIPANLVHIHGTEDKLLMPGNVAADFWVEAGGHFMVWNRAGEVSSIINKILDAQKLTGE